MPPDLLGRFGLREALQEAGAVVPESNSVRDGVIGIGNAVRHHRTDDAQLLVPRQIALQARAQPLARTVAPAVQRVQPIEHPADVVLRLRVAVGVRADEQELAGAGRQPLAFRERIRTRLDRRHAAEVPFLRRMAEPDLLVVDDIVGGGPRRRAREFALVEIQREHPEGPPVVLEQEAAEVRVLGRLSLDPDALPLGNADVRLAGEGREAQTVVPGQELAMLLAQFRPFVLRRGLGDRQ